MTHWMIEFERCAPWLRSALTASAVETITIGDVCALIARGEVQLHPFPNCAFVTRLDTFPSGLKTVSAVLGGGDMTEMLAVTPAIEDWARGQSCSHAFVSGRRGWERALAPQGYRFDKVILAKDLRDARHTT